MSTRRKTKAAALPDRSEWDFSEVPDEEAELCFLYEYARNAPGFLKLVAEWRTSNSTLVEQGERLLCSLARTAKTPAEAVELGAENQQRLGEWIQARWQAKLPHGFGLNNPRSALLLFKAFPAKPWQSLDQKRRELFWIVCPEAFGPPAEHIKFAGKQGVPPPITPSGFEKLLLTASRAFDEQNEAQKRIQSTCRVPVTDSFAAAAARDAIEKHIFAPPLIEEQEGIKLGLVGMLPPSFQCSGNGRIISAEGYSRETVTFVINWAATDEEIEEAMRRWIKKNREGKGGPFKRGNVTSAREYLRKLGALRVLEAGFTPDKATKKPEFGKVLYRDVDQYRRAKRQARAVIAILFPDAPTLEKG